MAAAALVINKFAQAAAKRTYQGLEAYLPAQLFILPCPLSSWPDCSASPSDRILGGWLTYASMYILLLPPDNLSGNAAIIAGMQICEWLIDGSQEKWKTLSTAIYRQ